MPKKEGLKVRRDLAKLDRNLGGIKNLEKLPAVVFVIDTKKEHIAVTEANRLKIPVVAVVDTNCDPDIIDYVIPGNDDAIRAAQLMSRVIADAVIEGKHIQQRRNARPGTRAEDVAGRPRPPHRRVRNARRSKKPRTRSSRRRPGPPPPRSSVRSKRARSRRRPRRPTRRSRPSRRTASPRTERRPPPRASHAGTARRSRHHDRSHRMNKEHG